MRQVSHGLKHVTPLARSHSFGVEILDVLLQHFSYVMFCFVCRVMLCLSFWCFVLSWFVLFCCLSWFVMFVLFCCLRFFVHVLSLFLFRLVFLLSVLFLFFGFFVIFFDSLFDWLCLVLFGCLFVRSFVCLIVCLLFLCYLVIYLVFIDLLLFCSFDWPNDKWCMMPKFCYCSPSSAKRPCKTAIWIA